MAGPVTLKAGSYPAAAGGLQGLRELSATEIKDQVAGVITAKFAADTDGSGTAELNVVTGGSAGGDEIGTFTNRERTESVGTHPAGGSTTDTVYRFNQPSAAVSESGQINPLRWTGTAVEQATDTELDTEVLDLVITAMAAEDANTIGQYNRYIFTFWWNMDFKIYSYRNTSRRNRCLLQSLSKNCTDYRCWN